MRILHTVAPARFGGLEEVAILLSGGLREHGHDVSVAVVLSEGEESHPFLSALRQEDVRVFPIRLASRRYAREVARVRDVVREVRPEVLHTHGYRPDVLHPLAARAANVPMVSTLHGFTGGGWKNRIYEWLQIRSVSRFDAVVAVSSAMVAPLRRRGVPERALHMIPNAWRSRVESLSAEAARARLGVEPGRFHVGWIGRLSHEKGPDVLLSASSRWHSNGRKVLSFIGDGPLAEPLAARVREDWPVDVRFHGLVPAAARLLPALDVLVSSSRTEGTPMVLFEAMAAGVPIVAAAVGGVPDVLSSDSAILVPAEDPTAVAEAVESVRADPEAARARAERARQILKQRYALSPWTRRYEQLYRSIGRARGVSRVSTAPGSAR